MSVDVNKTCGYLSFTVLSFTNRTKDTFFLLDLQSGKYMMISAETWLVLSEFMCQNKTKTKDQPAPSHVSVTCPSSSGSVKSISVPAMLYFCFSATFCMMYHNIHNYTCTSAALKSLKLSLIQVLLCKCVCMLYLSHSNHQLLWQHTIPCIAVLND